LAELDCVRMAADPSTPVVITLAHHSYLKTYGVSGVCTGLSSRAKRQTSASSYWHEFGLNLPPLYLRVKPAVRAARTVESRSATDSLSVRVSLDSLYWLHYPRRTARRCRIMGSRRSIVASARIEESPRVSFGMLHNRDREGSESHQSLHQLQEEVL
jgi:hypothetical protein